MRYKLSEIVELNPSSDIKVSKLEMISYLDTSNLTEGKIEDLVQLFPNIDKVPSRAKRVVIENDILYSTVRPNQRHYGIIKEPDAFLVASTGFAQLRVNTEKAIPDYVYWLLTQDFVIETLQAIAESSTSAYPSIRPSVITDLEFEFPSIQVQKQVVEILNNIAGKITNNYRMIEKLEDLSKGVFKHWFVDFEFPNESGQPYKSEGGEMVKSELGIIPDGWNIKNLDEITSKFATGLNPRKNFKLGEGNNFYVTIKNLGQNRIFLNDKCDKVTNEALVKINKRSNLKSGDLLFSGIGTIGRVFLIDEDPINWNISESLFTLRPNEKVSSEYLYLLLLSNNLQNYAIQLASGSVQKGIRMGDLKKYKVPLPPKRIMGIFTELVSPQIKLIKSLERESDKLSNLRDTLLPKLLTGEIEVPVLEPEQV